jgi:hypothetical protein
MTLTAIRLTTAARSTSAVTCAATAAGALVVNTAVGLLASGDELNDHTRGLGALSEVTAAAAFIAGAAALALLTPVRGWRAAAWWLAPFGLALGGASMLAVPVIGAEPPFWLFLLAVVPSFLGLIAAGILGTGRLWSWWAGLGLALFLPVMFIVPLNGPILAAIWAGVALSLKQSGSRADQPDGNSAE